MALRTQKGSDLPSGTVALSKKEALEYQWALIKNWHSEADVFSIKFGQDIVSGSTFFSSLYILNYFRKTLNVNRVRFLAILTPGVIIPTFVSHFITDNVITNSILLMKLSCPICDHLKFAGAQLYLSLMFPAIYGCISLSGFASVTKSYPIPSISTNAKDFWKVCFRILKQSTPHLQVVGLTQTILILFLPYLQNKQFINIMIKCQQRSSEELNSELY